MKEKNKSQNNFLVTIRSQENQSWQGTITWVEGNQKVNFRSTLELVRLMDSAKKKEFANLNG